jgi:hypothetical protein
MTSQSLSPNLSVGVKSGRFWHSINPRFHQPPINISTNIFGLLESAASIQVFLKEAIHFRNQRAKKNELWRESFGVLACQFRPLFTPTESTRYPTMNNRDFVFLSHSSLSYVCLVSTIPSIPYLSPDLICCSRVYHSIS